MTVDALFENRRRFEHHHTPRRDRDFRAGLRITTDTLTFLANHEAAERGELHRLALLQAVGYLLQYQLDESRRFGTGQPDLLIDGLAQIHACDCFSGSVHRLAPTQRRTISI